MIRIDARVLCGCLAAAMAGTAMAHGGHVLPPGVAPHAHLHLFDGVVAAPEWLLVLAIAAAAAVLVARRARRARHHGRAFCARRNGADRGRDHARRS